MSRKSYEICVDFDGTCVTHEYPHVGVEIGAAEVLKKLTDNGHRLIIFTMRSGEHLSNAYNWFARHEIPVYGVQENPTQKLWTQSPKAYGQIYIDDAALGCPLKQDDVELPSILGSNYEKDGKYFAKPDRPYVDWEKVEQMLTEKGLL